MKFAIPEISWHNRDPVLSVDFQPTTESNEPLRLASSGTDAHVLIWHISTIESGGVHLEVAADLVHHQKAVNVVRWSPNGQYLASGDDESFIFVWKQKTDEREPAPTQNVEQGEEVYKETWVIHKTLRGHMEDVLDISWNMNSTQLASGSVDNKLIVWDVGRGQYTSILADHKGFVQGVAWDPKGQLIASASSDRVFRTFDVGTKKVFSRSSKATLPFPSGHPLRDVKVRLYHDDTLQTYYRRLQFSPDGMLVAVPSGKIQPEQGKLDTKPINAVYIYTRYCLKTPACVVPCGAEPALVCRWSPQQYQVRGSEGGGRAAFPLPQRRRCVLAVGTRRSIILYDTQQRAPVALVANVHYTRLTDLTWSPDGRVLVASSTDGYCSVVTFSEDELGQPLPPDSVHTNCAEPMGVQMEEQQNESPKEKVSEETKPTNTSKLDSFIKFKTPTEKSPKKQKTETNQDKTPVKLDVLVETAMQSWSDNSSNEIIKPKDSEPMEVEQENEIVVIEDSEDIKLVYDESQTDKCSSQESIKDKSLAATSINTSPENSEKNDEKSDSHFLKQAKVTDVKDPIGVKNVASPKAPRRVNFITLSSPKNSKKKC